MTSFGVKTPHDFLTKLLEEYDDFQSSNSLSSRHAINVAVTAYHLHEWVWVGFASSRADLRSDWGLSSTPTSREFREKLFERCMAMKIAQQISNGTKHFDFSRIETGHHSGAFQRGAFQRNAFDVSRLWVDRNGEKQDAMDFVRELVAFWQGFFAKYGSLDK